MDQTSGERNCGPVNEAVHQDLRKCIVGKNKVYGGKDTNEKIHGGVKPGVSNAQRDYESIAKKANEIHHQEEPKENNLSSGMF